MFFCYHLQSCLSEWNFSSLHNARAGVRLQKPRTINVLNITTQMFQLISLHKNKTDIIWKFDGEEAKTLGK